MGYALAELAQMSEGLLESYHPGADFALFELAALEIVRGYGHKLASKAAEKRNDGVRSIERDN